jgi:hypothetical protein
MHALCADVRRDLEITARQNEVLPLRRQEGNRVVDVPKKRFSIGRRVLVGMGMRPAVVKSSDDKPSVMGEYRHVVVFGDSQEERRVMGCDLQPVPELDQDLGRSAPAIHIHNSNVGNINLGSQIGQINVALEQISSGNEAQKEFARALDEFTKAVVAADLPGTQKKDVVEALSTVAKQAAKKPEERSSGTLKAIMGWMPEVIASAAHLKALWEHFGPAIKTYFGL